jgi:hypothetical protein
MQAGTGTAGGQPLNVEVSQGFEYGLDFYGLLNGLRASFKKKTLSRDILGEMAVNELV